jgi:hypothetical protein
VRRLRARLRGLLADGAVVGELLAYLWRSRRWWLIPIVIALLLVGFLLLLATNPSLGPFIYTLF